MKRYQKVKLVDWPPVMRALIKNPVRIAVNATPPEDGRIVVAPGNGNEIKELPENCVLVDTMHEGGTICVFRDGITLFTVDESEPDWLEQLVEFLRSRGVEATRGRNDLLVEGRKAAGYTSFALGDSGLRLNGIHISINMDVELIRRVCNKPMYKIPAGLSEYGITRQDVMTALGIEE